MITVLSFGGGQDSTAILYRIALDAEFRNKYVKGKFLVLMSDTGDEHPLTYQHVEFIRAFCEQHAIEFRFLRSEDGYHPRTWPGLIPWMKAHDGILSKAYPKTCTCNLKIRPLYNFLDQYIGRTAYHSALNFQQSKKGFIKAYVRQHGKIRILLGIAKGEEGRVDPTFSDVWMTKCLSRVYPLLAEGLDRHGCQQWIKASGLPLPPPSNCMRYPFLNAIELVWLFKFHPDKYHEWVQLEKAKVDKWKQLGTPDQQNLGVNGRKLLPEVLANALQLYGHLTDQELDDYKMSHGHCVQSKF